jgi:nascent polypeptide-associated complex subunit beta
MDTSGIDQEKLAKLQRMAAGVRTGGKGSVRRKKKAVHKAAPTDDKRLQSTLKRLQLNVLPGIEEVSIIRENGTMIHFKNPKVQAQISANTYVVSGTAETKPLTDMMSSAVGGAAGTPDMAQIQAMMEQLKAGNLNLPDGLDMSALAKAAAQEAGDEDEDDDGNDDDDDDDVPDLVDSANFEETAKNSEE